MPIYTPRPRAEHSSALFFSGRRGEGFVLLYLTSYAHEVFDEMPEPLVKLSPLETRPPSSIFPEICLGLAVRHAPSPSSPSSITRAELIAGTTVVSLLFLSSF